MLRRIGLVCVVRPVLRRVCASGAGRINQVTDHDSDQPVSVMRGWGKAHEMTVAVPWPVRQRARDTGKEARACIPDFWR